MATYIKATPCGSGCGPNPCGGCTWDGAGGNLGYDTTENVAGLFTANSNVAIDVDVTSHCDTPNGRSLSFTFDIWADNVSVHSTGCISVSNTYVNTASVPANTASLRIKHAVCAPLCESGGDTVFTVVCS